MPCLRRCRSWAWRALLAMARTRLWLREEERRRKPGPPADPSPGGLRLVGDVMSPACWKPVSQRSCSVRVSRCRPRPTGPSPGGPRRWPRREPRLWTRGAKSSAVRSPRLLDLVAAGQSWRPARGRQPQGGRAASGRGRSSSGATGSWLAARRLGLDLLLVTASRSRWAAEAEHGRRGRRPAEAPGRLSRPRPRPGSERSITVSLDDRLEDEDTLSLWLPGSSRCHSLSAAVMSEYIAAEAPAGGRRPPGGSEDTCASLLALLTMGRWLRARGWPLLSVWLLGPPPLHAHCLLSKVRSVSLWWLWVLSCRGTEAP